MTIFFIKGGLQGLDGFSLCPPSKSTHAIESIITILLMPLGNIPAIIYQHCHMTSTIVVIFAIFSRIVRVNIVIIKCNYNCNFVATSLHFAMFSLAVVYQIIC